MTATMRRAVYYHHALSDANKALENDAQYLRDDLPNLSDPPAPVGKNADTMPSAAAGATSGPPIIVTNDDGVATSTTPAPANDNPPPLEAAGTE